MKLSIRSKFIGILAVAVLLPLAIAVLTFNWFGERTFQNSQGAVCQATASQLALSITYSLRHEIESLQKWIDFAGLGLQVQALGKGLLPGGGDQKSTDALDARWPGLAADAPEVAACLQNDLARQLRDFQKRNPSFSEILVTDRLGRLVAATNKTSDYGQADEHWWQEASHSKADTAYVEGLTFDESARSHAIEISLPLFDLRDPGAGPVGVLKGVLNIMPFFQAIQPLAGDMKTVHEVVLGTGETLFRLEDPGLVPLGASLPPSITTPFLSHEPGWILDHLPGKGAVIVGFAPIGLAREPGDDLRIQGMNPMWAVAIREERTALGPLRASMRSLSLIGLGLAGVFVLLGYYIASQHIIAPINSLERAARAISQSVRLGEERSFPPANLRSSREPIALLQDVDGIKTGDEIEDLASEFSFMGRRVLSWQEKMEAEIAEKTGEIRRDLDFARQFQTNLMPRKYPEVPSASRRPGPGLNFHHVYRPASTMGGDFFNVLKLGDSRAGVFIADVMGHGARSALVTAIIATLLQDADKQAGNPADVLSSLNRHFYEVLRNTGDVVFVSAFYLVLDVAAMTATYASAGHPSPLLLDRATGRVIELTPHLINNPALGLFEDCSYDVAQRPIRENDLFLLFTDGLFECRNARGQEFGRERLIRMVGEHRESDLTRMVDSLVSAAAAFSGQERPADDVCLVGVEVAQKLGSRTLQAAGEKPH